MQAGEWPELRESLAIKETRAFARKLEDLARAAQCNPLAAYAGALASHAETLRRARPGKSSGGVSRADSGY